MSQKSAMPGDFGVQRGSLLTLSTNLNAVFGQRLDILTVGGVSQKQKRQDLDRKFPVIFQACNTQRQRFLENGRSQGRVRFINRHVTRE